MPLADTWMHLETGKQSELSQENKYCINVGSRKVVKKNLLAKYRHRNRKKKYIYIRISTKGTKSGWHELEIGI